VKWRSSQHFYNRKRNQTLQQRVEWARYFQVSLAAAIMKTLSIEDRVHHNKNSTLDLQMLSNRRLFAVVERRWSPKETGRPGHRHFSTLWLAPWPATHRQKMARP
jgi:hypothetical protein